MRSEEVEWTHHDDRSSGGWNDDGRLSIGIRKARCLSSVLKVQIKLASQAQAFTRSQQRNIET